jgi:Asp-tRNA(Asn)/Glu-tRNA(Gln) amidotransferase A subunit family amidase
VAAGQCLAALGTDTLGSVRIPASYCGVVGYVPGRGLIAMDGVQPLAPSFDRVGILARSVSDVACVAAAIAPSVRIGSAAGAAIGILDGLEPFVPKDILAAVESAAQRLPDAGRRLVRIDASGFDWSAARKAALLTIEIEAARVFTRWLDDPNAKLSSAVREAFGFGRRADAERIERATRHLDAARRRIGEWLERAQVIVLPATPQTAFAFGNDVPASQADCATPSSILGLPALSIPAPLAKDELPIGVQLLAARGADALLLGVASALASGPPGFPAR